ncbi:MAG: glycosyltransferase [Clostridia bacterium]|nr:glycosyltransferase [Clostridia bacterium]
MIDFRYKISVVIPVYNCAEFIDDCIRSLRKQSMRFDDFEIIFVDDGSEDNGGELCVAYAARYSNVRCIRKENGGVSSARNAGIQCAQGKYILFLDADDTLTPPTLKRVYAFFEKHYDETDLVTYKIVPYRNGEPQKLHFRYQILKESGIYDLNDLDNCHIVQTTMNICVKNLGDQNPLFDTALTIHEDQKFICSVLREKQTIGYCKGAEYRYLRRPNSAMSKVKAYYIFEDTTALWESMFAAFDGAPPRYLQAYVLHDLNWKNVSDVLLPYHYEPQKFDAAVERLRALARQIDDDVILSRPSADFYHKHFLLQFKGSDAIQLKCEDGKLALLYAQEPVYEAEAVTAVFNSLKMKNDQIEIDAFLKSPVFLYADEPQLFLCADGDRVPLQLTHSLHERYHANIKTAVFWRFCCKIDLNQTTRFHFEAVVNGMTVPIICYYTANAALLQGKKLRTYVRDGRVLREQHGVFTVRPTRTAGARLLMAAAFLYHIIFYGRVDLRILRNRIFGLQARFNKERIWIYQDRYGVYDNAYDQFLHDAEKQDGVKRYYVTHPQDAADIPERFPAQLRDRLITYGSARHKYLYFACEKIITSFSNLSNFCPFSGAMRWYRDLAGYELVYLQHGVLHANLLKMYGKEFGMIDRVVVSSGFEQENFVRNYGYAPEELIPSGMPRYDAMQPDGKKKNRILFSPSWRSNLIGGLINQQREEKPELFLASDFYREVSAFLNSPALNALLEQYDLYLDFKNHPIFQCYNPLFEISGDRVHIGDSGTKQEEYRLMITDYSSIVFDSVYLGCPVVYFVPDYDKFLAGVSHNYRKLDLPLEEGFGPFAKDAEELLAAVAHAAENDFIPDEPYRSRMDGFFLHHDQHCRDRLYAALIDD